MAQSKAKHGFTVMFERALYTRQPEWVLFIKQHPIGAALTSKQALKFFQACIREVKGARKGKP